MTNADSELWTFTEGVGASVLAVAMARRIEADSQCPLFSDPFAQTLIDTAVARGAPMPTGETADRIMAMSDYTASRTKWFDEFLIAAGAHGLEQAVILAAGLDARAWRLPWTSSSTVFEIDHPAVLAVKAEALSADEPAVKYVADPADDADDWPELLRCAGFNASEPAAWAIDGLLPSAGPDPHPLFARIHDLSALGSRIAVEVVGPGVGAWLTGCGWEITTTDAAQVTARYGRCGGHGAAETLPDTVFVDGRLPLTPTVGTPPSL